MSAGALDILIAEAALARCAADYARGADRRDKALWRAVLAEDCVIAGPGFVLEGREANLGSIDLLGRMFRATRHVIHQLRAEIDGDSARGETHCTADHLLAGEDAVLSWAIRYQDSWLREGGVWRFTRRELVVDWEEQRPVTVRGALA